MALHPCPSCQQHYFTHDAACPHCQAPNPSQRPRLTKRLAVGGLMLLTAVSATACYGTPPLPVPPTDPSLTTGVSSDYVAQGSSDAAAAPKPDADDGTGTGN